MRNGIANKEIASMPAMKGETGVARGVLISFHAAQAKTPTNNIRMIFPKCERFWGRAALDLLCSSAAEADVMDVSAPVKNSFAGSGGNLKSGRP